MVNNLVYNFLHIFGYSLPLIYPQTDKSLFRFILTAYITYSLIHTGEDDEFLYKL